MCYPTLSATLLLLAPLASAQWTPENPGSENVTVLGHVPLGGKMTVTDMELEQELHRPYAYVGRASILEEGPEGHGHHRHISNPAMPHVLLRWRLEDQDLHMSRGGMDVKYFKWQGR